MKGGLVRDLYFSAQGAGSCNQSFLHLINGHKKPNCSMIHHVCTYITYIHTYIHTRIVMHVKAGTDKIERARVVSHLLTDTMYLSFDTSIYSYKYKYVCTRSKTISERSCMVCRTYM